MLKVIVPAFPRSGTSFLAGLIARMGLNPGPEHWLKKGDRHNRWGYYECLPLFKISRKILAKLDGDFFFNIPELPKNWSNQFEKEKQQILDIVNTGEIELFKDGPMLIIADLYDELFPDAKWIVINREPKATYRSRFGKRISYEEWKEITGKRQRAWQKTRPFSRALNLHYLDFFTDLAGTIEKLASFLGANITERQKQSCFNFFQPNI
jgi:hypothetical protein